MTPARRLYSGWAQFIKLSAIRNPSRIFVFLDESPQTINDGWYVFCNNGPNGNLWSDMPAYYHNGACGFSFADGHSEIKRWQVSSTIVPFTVWPIPDWLGSKGFPLGLAAGYLQESVGARGEAERVA